MIETSDSGDRDVVEKGEARVLVHGFIHNGESKDWLENALRFSRRIYRAGSEDRIRAHMNIIWREEALR